MLSWCESLKVHSHGPARLKLTKPQLVCEDRACCLGLPVHTLGGDAEGTQHFLISSAVCVWYPDPVCVLAAVGSDSVLAYSGH